MNTAMHVLFVTMGYQAGITEVVHSVFAFSMPCLALTRKRAMHRLMQVGGGVVEHNPPRRAYALDALLMLCTFCLKALFQVAQSNSLTDGLQCGL